MADTAHSPDLYDSSSGSETSDDDDNITGATQLPSSPARKELVEIQSLRKQRLRDEQAAEENRLSQRDAENDIRAQEVCYSATVTDDSLQNPFVMIY